MIDNAHDFQNALRMLTNIDWWELTDAGVLTQHDSTSWLLFRDNPLHWLIRADEGKAEKLWALMQKRMKPATPAEIPASAPLTSAAGVRAS